MFISLFHTSKIGIFWKKMENRNWEVSRRATPNLVPTFSRAATFPRTHPSQGLQRSFLAL